MNSIILGALGPWQIVIVVLVIVLLFGSAKIPELMRNLGKGVNEFKKSTKSQSENDSFKQADGDASREKE